MDYLQEGISLRAYAQRDPVVEYQREGFDMFQQMLEGIKEEAVGFLFNLEVQVEEAPAPVDSSVPLPDTEPHVEIHAKGLGGTRTPRALQYSAPAIDGEAGTSGVVVERDQAPALGIGGSGNGKASGGPNGARGGGSGSGSGSGTGRSGAGSGSGTGTARRSGPPAPGGSRKPSPGQVVGGGGPSRNAPCPCGSGKKYKRCHGAPGAS
jgi:preprotein translocase subunit SecA